VSVTVANAAAPATPPVVQILSPAAGTIKGKGGVSITTSASDASGVAGITQTLYIDGAAKANASGATLSYTWNTNKVASGPHTIQVVAKDPAGNSSSASVQVTK